MKRQVKPCKCGKQEVYGNCIWKWTNRRGGRWTHVANVMHAGTTQTIAQIKKAVIIKCNGCGEELLRETP